MNIYPKIAIVYLSFHCEPYIDDVVSAIKHITYPKDQLEFIIVDNPHPEFGSSMRYLEEQVLPLSGKEFPRVTLLPQTENIGFASGSNVGTELAITLGCTYIFYHNNDGFLAANALEPLVETLEANMNIAAAQSLMLLHPETDLVNTYGNEFHYLGFGYTGGYRIPVKTLNLPKVKEIGYASGAAVMVRTEFIKKFGAWDDQFYLYHEDLEFSMRMRITGGMVVMVRDSVFYHKYQFGRSIEKFYWMERNRFAVLLMYYRWPTLVLLLPMLILVELGLLCLSTRDGWIMKERKKVYAYWWNRTHVSLWLQKRMHIQQIRTVGDRVLLRKTVSDIQFQDASVDKPWVHYLANPGMTVYYWLVRALVRW